jgi:hypothetical protein
MRRHWTAAPATGLAALCALAAACASPPPTAAPAASAVERILADYPEWILLTPEPRSVSFVLWGLCRSIMPPETAFQESEHGSRYLRIYVNEVGAAPLALEGERHFPEGSIIVKEKLIAPDDAAPAAVGIMIKRENGFDPEGGDWEYAYWEKDGGLSRDQEQLATCQACHTGEGISSELQQDYAVSGLLVSTQARDSVFLTLPGHDAP